MKRVIPSMGRAAAWIHRHFAWILTLATILTGVSALYSARLYRNLRTNFEELLPSDARSVRDLREVQGRLQAPQSLAILVFSRHPAESKRFVTDLAHRLERAFPDQISRVEYNIRREIAFFHAHRALYLTLADLRRIRDYVRDRIEYEKELHNPLNIFATHELPVPVFDFRRLDQSYVSRLSAYTRFTDGYYANADQTVRAVLVFAKGSGWGTHESERLVARVMEVVAALNPRAYAPDIVVKYTGDIANLVEEHHSLIADLKHSTILVILLVNLAMLIFYRDAWLTTALVASLIAGTLWTFGIAYFAVGYLNANSAFLGSIVLGNGINYGIIYLARYLEERRRGRPHPPALRRAFVRTAPATLTAALAAALSYGSLVITAFRGFRQFGVIGLMGMALCWISAYTVLPAALTLCERLRPWDRRRPAAPRRGIFSLALSRVVFGQPRLILALSTALVLASAFAVIGHRGPIIETDTSKLRDRRSVQSGSTYLTRYLNEVFGRYLTPMVILAQTPDDRDRIARDLDSYRHRHGPAGLIANVYTIQDFVPRDQREKIRILREIEAMVTPAVLAQLPERERRLDREFLGRGELRPIGVADLPPLVLDRFRLQTGAIGNLVLVEPVINEEALRDGDNQTRLVQTLRTAADRIHPGTPVVGSLPVTVDMYWSVRQDGPKATALAFSAVLLLVTVLFRRLRTVLLAQYALILGVTWLAGTVLFADLKINFLNFIALPVTFGIGVDYGVNILSRYRSEGRGSIVHVIRGTGGAVALASLTTIIGYGSLLLAGNQAFFSFGRLAILGEIFCLSAAIASLPALLNLLDRREEHAEVPEVEVPERPERKAA